MALEAEMDAKKKQEEAAKPAAPAAPAPKPDNIVLLEQIRDEIKTLKTSDGK
jgi:large-conductance mechanosensitive channel